LSFLFLFKTFPFLIPDLSSFFRPIIFLSHTLLILIADFSCSYLRPLIFFSHTLPLLVLHSSLHESHTFLLLNLLYSSPVLSSSNTRTFLFSVETFPLLISDLSYSCLRPVHVSYMTSCLPLRHSNISLANPPLDHSNSRTIEIIRLSSTLFIPLTVFNLIILYIIYFF
jgi:hypothetical protein